MSIAQPCPYSEDSEFCKFERYSGQPEYQHCDKCSEKRKYIERNKVDAVKNTIPHSVHSIKERWQNYTAKYKCLAQGDAIYIQYNDEDIAVLGRPDNGFGTRGRYKFILAEMDDLEGIYKFLKSKGIRFKKL